MRARRQPNTRLERASLLRASARLLLHPGLTTALANRAGPTDLWLWNTSCSEAGWRDIDASLTSLAPARGVARGAPKVILGAKDVIRVTILRRRASPILAGTHVVWGEAQGEPLATNPKTVLGPNLMRHRSAS